LSGIIGSEKRRALPPLPPKSKVEEVQNGDFGPFSEIGDRVKILAGVVSQGLDSYYHRFGDRKFSLKELGFLVPISGTRTPVSSADSP
jgi:hypothetical protein